MKNRPYQSAKDWKRNSERYRKPNFVPIHFYHLFVAITKPRTRARKTEKKKKNNFNNFFAESNTGDNNKKPFKRQNVIFQAS